MWGMKNDRVVRVAMKRGNRENLDKKPEGGERTEKTSPHH